MSYQLRNRFIDRRAAEARQAEREDNARIFENYRADCQRAQRQRKHEQQEAKEKRAA